MDKVFFVHDSAICKNTTGKKNSAVYKECNVVDCRLEEGATVGDYSRLSDCVLGEMVAIQRHAQMFSVEMGRYSYTGKNFTAWNCKIGAFCSISWNVSIGGANHDYSRVTTHAFLYSPSFKLMNGEAGYDRFNDNCIIGNDVWIAAGACICRGVTVGDGAVIGAGAVVTKDVPPYTIVAGVPAKPLKKRFDDEIIALLQESKWWELPANVIKENFDLFNAKPTVDIAKRICGLSNLK